MAREMTDKMTIEKAREINIHENTRGSWEWLRNFIGEPFCQTFKCESIFGEAKGFIEGYESRQGEIELLKSEVEELKRIIKIYGKHHVFCGRAYEGCTCGLSQLIAEHGEESK